MNNVVYITTNKLNGKQYVGDHILINENDGYLGSGKLITDAINKYGKENFTRKILKKFKTKKDAFNAQEKYIDKYNTLVPNGYNISPTGGLGVRGCHLQETKEKIANSCSKSLKGRIISEEHRRKLSESGKIHNSGKNNPMYGIKHTPESIEKNRQSNLGKPAWNKGKTFSEETRKKMSESRKGKIPWNKKQK